MRLVRLGGRSVSGRHHIAYPPFSKPQPLPQKNKQGRGFAARTAEYNHAMFACLDRHWETALELFRELEAGGAGVPR